MLRALIDPNTAPLRALSREDRDLFIAATNGHVLAFDNVSGLPAWLSDTLCRLATGGGFATRQLYTNQEEVLLDATRPIILNGIKDFVTLPDLADRALLLTLEPISEERRRSEKRSCGRPLRQSARAFSARYWTPWQRASQYCHRLAGSKSCRAWLTSRSGQRRARLSSGLKAPSARPIAANPENVVETAIHFDPVASALRAFSMTKADGMWKRDRLGSFWLRFSHILVDESPRPRTWPNSPRGLSGRLRRAATFLRKIGIDISFERQGRTRTRMIHITTTGNSPESGGAQPSASSAPSAYPPKANPANHFIVQGVRTVGNPADGSKAGSSSTVRANTPKFNGADDADGADAKISPQSAPRNASLDAFDAVAVEKGETWESEL